MRDAQHVVAGVEKVAVDHAQDPVVVQAGRVGFITVARRVARVVGHVVARADHGCFLHRALRAQRRSTRSPTHLKYELEQVGRAEVDVVEPEDMVERLVDRDRRVAERLDQLVPQLDEPRHTARGSAISGGTGAFAEGGDGERGAEAVDPRCELAQQLRRAIGR